MVERSPSGLFTSLFSVLYYCGESFLQTIVAGQAYNTSQCKKAKSFPHNNIRQKIIVAYGSLRDSNVGENGVSWTTFCLSFPGSQKKSDSRKIKASTHISGCFLSFEIMSKHLWQRTIKIWLVKKKWSSGSTCPRQGVSWSTSRGKLTHMIFYT